MESGTANDDGTVSTTVSVSRLLFAHSSNRWIDCAEVGCTLTMWAGDFTLTEPLSFDASVPAPPAPSVESSYSADGATVTVEGTDMLLDSETVWISLCADSLAQREYLGTESVVESGTATDQEYRTSPTSQPCTETQVTTADRAFSAQLELSPEITEACLGDPEQCPLGVHGSATYSYGPVG